MASYGGGCQVEPSGERRRGRGPLLEDRPGHPLTGRLVGLEFHNASVPLLLRPVQVRLASLVSRHHSIGGPVSDLPARAVARSSGSARRSNPGEPIMRIFSSGRYAVVTSTLALVIALGGTSYAAVKITGKDIVDGTVATEDIKDRHLTVAGRRPGSARRPQGAGRSSRPAGPSRPRRPSGPSADRPRRADRTCRPSRPPYPVSKPLDGTTLRLLSDLQGGPDARRWSRARTSPAAAGSREPARATRGTPSWFTCVLVGERRGHAVDLSSGAAPRRGCRFGARPTRSSFTVRRRTSPSRCPVGARTSPPTRRG